MKNKYVKGFIIGLIFAFPLGINFGKDVPLFSNPFSAKPDLADRVIERAEVLIEDTKGAIHSATTPADKQLSRR